MCNPRNVSCFRLRPIFIHASRSLLFHLQRRGISCSISSRLDLAHGRRAAADATGTATHAGTALHAHGGEGERCDVGGEEEPQEGGAGLRLTADLDLVVDRVVDDAGGAGVAEVVAAVGAKLGSQDDTGDECEEGVEAVKDGGNDGVTLEAVVERGRDGVEQGQHGEGGREHHVVGGRGRVGVARGDGVANECHDQEGAEELEASEAEAEDLGHFGGGEVGRARERGRL